MSRGVALLHQGRFPGQPEREGLTEPLHRERPQVRHHDMKLFDFLTRTFTWWNGQTWGTYWFTRRHGERVGEDEFGNRYYQSRDNVSYDGRKRRWVIYNGYAEATKVPPEWQGWLRYTYDEAPSEKPLPRKAFEKDHMPNLTGTPYARRPQGSLAAIGQRPAATGDYQAWTPE